MLMVIIFVAVMSSGTALSCILYTLPLLQATLSPFTLQAIFWPIWSAIAEQNKIKVNCNILFHHLIILSSYSDHLRKQTTYSHHQESKNLSDLGNKMGIKCH